MNSCDDSTGINGSFVEFLGFGCANIYEAPNSSYNLRRPFCTPHQPCIGVELLEVGNWHLKTQPKARQNEDH